VTPTSTLSPAQGAFLLRLARAAVGRALGVTPAGDEEQPSASAGLPQPWLDEPGAVFVTLTQDGELRGCIGSLEPRRPLREDVERNAVAAALQDPRFEPLDASELPRTRFEISVLTRPVPLPVSGEDDAKRKLRPLVDGVVLAAGPWRSTFLPQVWEELPDPAEFMAHLKMKAGLPARGWPPGATLHTYQVNKFTETAP
jgi:AmmeMemoRadiSam system protein A